MLNFNKQRKESFRQAWLYHRQEFLVFIAAAVFTCFLRKILILGGEVNYFLCVYSVAVRDYRADIALRNHG